MGYGFECPHPANAQIVEEAYRIFNNIQETSYSLSPQVDEDCGLYHTNCSALLNYILKIVAPHPLSWLYIEPTHSYPRAFSFYQTIMDSAPIPSSPWMHITSLHDAIPGDLLAWRVNETIEPNKNTGHVVILLDFPQKQPDGIFICKVFDAASLPHSNDSRPRGTNGVGIGEMRILADGAGVPMAYYWSYRQKKPRFKPMAIGRIRLSEFLLHSPSSEGPQCPAMHLQAR